MTRTRRALRRALITITVAVAAVVPAASLTASPAAAAEFYTQNHGYTVIGPLFSTETITYDGGPSKVMIGNSLTWRSDTFWPNPANFAQISDNQARQDAASWVGGDRNRHSVPFTNGICHPAYPGSCTAAGWSPTLEEMFVFAWYGWFGTCPGFVVTRTLSNSSIVFSMIQRGGSC